MSATAVSGCVYRGFAEGRGRWNVAVEEEGGLMRLLPHHVRHSPDGFAWGYLGSGPSELARCILIDVLRDRTGLACFCGHPAASHDEVPAPGVGRHLLVEEPHCKDCEADPGLWPLHRFGPPHEPSATCCYLGERQRDYERLVPASLYQRFKEQFVGRWDQDRDWALELAAVVAWVKAYERTEVDAEDRRLIRRNDDTPEIGGIW